MRSHRACSAPISPTLTHMGHASSLTSSSGVPCPAGATLSCTADASITPLAETPALDHFHDAVAIAGRHNKHRAREHDELVSLGRLDTRRGRAGRRHHPCSRKAAALQEPTGPSSQWAYLFPGSSYCAATADFISTLESAPAAAAETAAAKPAAAETSTPATAAAKPSERAVSAAESSEAATAETAK